MLIRKHYIADDEALGDAETKLYDINYLNPITAIDISVRMTTGAAGASSVPVPFEVSNISIVDGSFNLLSGIMSALMANQPAVGAGLPGLHYEAGITKVNEGRLRLHFGLFYGDREHYLNPTQFNNLQLRITSAFTIHANNYVTGLGKVTVIAHVLEGPVSANKGVLMTKEVARPTLAANASQVVDLPVDHPYIGFTLAAYSATVLPQAIINEFKVSQDADSLIWFDEEILDILKQNFSESGYVPADLDELTDWVVTSKIGLVPATVLATVHAFFGGMWVNPCTFKLGNIIPVAGINSLKAKLLGGATGGEVRVLTNQIFTG